MEKLFMALNSREICRSRIILLGLILFLLLPCTLAAQDFSDLKRKAEQGDAHSQVDLGLLYENGKGVPQDYKEAVKWYLKAAEQGNASGQNNLGLMYWNGKGVTQDYNEAVKWYRKAADQGNVYGQNNLGDAYRDGKGVPQDYNEAVKWWRKSAEQGNAYGQNSLGTAYSSHGRGVLRITKKQPSGGENLLNRATSTGRTIWARCTRMVKESPRTTRRPLSGISRLLNKAMP